MQDIDLVASMEVVTQPQWWSRPAGGRSLARGSGHGVGGAWEETMVSVRRLVPAEWREAFPIVVQLRTALDQAEFLQRVRRQSFSGYELVGAFSDGALVGVLGMRPVHTLARGGHLHVDDLVVDERVRSGGIGRALLAFAEEDARARGLNAVFLDARREAIPFYERERYDFHPAPSMKKLLGG